MPGAIYLVIVAALATGWLGWRYFRVRRPSQLEQTLRAQFARAKALQESGKTSEAEAAYRALLDARTKRAELSHPDTLGARNNLALLIATDGRADEAAEISEMTTESYSHVYGIEHQDTLLSRSNLGLIRFTQGRFADAAALHYSVLTARMKVLGKSSPYTLQSRLFLAQSLSRLGRTAEAERHLRTNVEVLTDLHGAERPEPLEARIVLAETLSQHDKLTESHTELAAVVTAARTHLGAGHPVTVTARRARASALLALGRFDDAEFEYRAVLADSDSPHNAVQLVRSITTISLTYLRAVRGERESAAAELRTLTEDCAAQWGLNTAPTRYAHTILAEVLLLSGQAGEAVTLFSELIDHLVRTNGPHDAAILCSRHQLGSALLQVGRIDDAEQEFRASLDRADRPPEHSCSLTCRQGLAKIAASRGHLDKAATEFADVLAGLTNLYGDDHPTTLDARFELADLQARQGNTADAITAHRAILEARTKLLGADHPDTHKSQTALRQVGS